MNQNALQSNAVGLDARASFAARPPSPTWERIVPAECPQNYLWAWFKPAHLPHGLILRIPDETYAAYPQLAAQWTMRRLLLTAGVDPASVATWQIHGVVYDAMGGTSPILDAGIPYPVPGMDPHINVVVHAPLMLMPPQIFAPPPMMPMPHVASVPHMAPAHPLGATAQPVTNVVPATLEDAYKNIELDWAASLEIERDLTRLRKQLIDMMGRLKSLNRELTPPERLYSSNQDKKDWQDARRWLRDSSTKCWRCVKDHDIGDTSSAGQRKWFEETHDNTIVPRKHLDNLQQVTRDFAGYRKLVQTLHNAMSSTHSMAAIDGERRAQSVLTRIAQKVREATNRKNFLGVILDS